MSKIMITEAFTDIATGESGVRDVYAERVLSESEALEVDKQAAKNAFNANIHAQLAANDAKIVRAVVENDAVRLERHTAAQAVLRSQLLP